MPTSRAMQHAVGAVLADLGVLLVGEGEQRHRLAVLLEDDLELFEVRPRGLDGDFEGAGGADEPFGLVDLNVRAGQASGVEVGAAEGEDHDQDEAEQETHLLMIPAGRPAGPARPFRTGQGRG